MLNEIARLQRESIGPDDINAVIAQFLTTLLRRSGNERGPGVRSGAKRIDLWGLAQFSDVSGKLRAVTPADVQRVSQKYMRNIRFVVLGNPQQIDKNVFTGQAGS
jgi:predicted Zn-dependent peptidase